MTRNRRTVRYSARLQHLSKSRTGFAVFRRFQLLSLSISIKSEKRIAFVTARSQIKRNVAIFEQSGDFRQIRFRNGIGNQRNKADKSQRRRSEVVLRRNSIDAVRKSNKQSFPNKRTSSPPKKSLANVERRRSAQAALPRQPKRLSSTNRVGPGERFVQHSRRGRLRLDAAHVCRLWWPRPRRALPPRI